MTDALPPGARRILLVEDDALNRALVRAVLARSADPELRGVCLVEAGDLAQARAVLMDAPVDVVMLDLGLPDGSGLDLAAELRNDHGARPPAMVAVTGESAPAQASEAMAAGCRAVLAKPYTPADLCSVLVAMLSGDPAMQDGGNAAGWADRTRGHAQ